MKACHLLCLWVFASLVILTACRKDMHFAVREESGISSGLLELAKAWHAQNVEPETNGSRLKPIWEDAWTLKSGLLIVPAPEYPNYNPKITIRRFFAFTSGNGVIVDGRIVEFLGNEYDVNANVELLVTNIDKDFIDGFDGSILRYDINYRFLSSSAFKKGKKLHNVLSVIETMSGEELQELQKKGAISAPAAPAK